MVIALSSGQAKQTFGISKCLFCFIKIFRIFNLNIGFYVESFAFLWYNILNSNWEGVNMAVSYKKLWKLLIDKDMKKKDLRVATGITTTALAKLGRNENVNTEILVKICKVLQCDISDIMEIVEAED